MAESNETRERNERRIEAALERCEDCDLPTRVTRLEQAVYGDEDIGLRGLRDEVRELNANVRAMLARWDKLTWIVIGASIGAAFGGSALTTLLLNVLKAAAP